MSAETKLRGVEAVKAEQLKLGRDVRAEAAVARGLYGREARHVGGDQPERGLVRVVAGDEVCDARRKVGVRAGKNSGYSATIL